MVVYFWITVILLRLINSSSSTTSGNLIKEQYGQWTCVGRVCSKSRFQTNNTQEGLSLETCRKTCTDHPIWPKPKSLKFFNRQHSQFLKNRIQHNIEAPTKTTAMLNDYMKIFYGYLKENDSTTEGNTVKINVQVLNKNDILQLELGTNENYTVIINLAKTINVTIVASTYFGARNGLESLSQLIWFDPVKRGYQILHELQIDDSPSFTYRGVMVDTSRNFFPIQLLQKVIDGMSYSKLNTLHLHLTDAVSFPMVLENLEWLSQGGAYSSKATYSRKEIETLIQYALIRGVRVLLEIDAPSHVSAGWHSNKDQPNLVICDQDDILKGQLNPDNENSLIVLRQIYQNLLKLMKNNETFHIGGDEVDLNCWRKTKAAENVNDMIEFWANYMNRMIDNLKIANGNELPKNIILWSSPLTDSYEGLRTLKHKKNLIVQYWFGQHQLLLDENYRIIFSTVGHWYLDCGFGPWKPSQQNGVCDPYTPWQEFYKYQPWYRGSTRILTEGGEVCLWAEQVAEESLETRIWPRAAAFAERVWSDPSNFEQNVYKRLDNFREIMRSRGLEVSAIWPKWCSMNPGSCV